MNISHPSKVKAKAKVEVKKNLQGRHFTMNHKIHFFHDSLSGFSFYFLQSIPAHP